MTWLVVGGFAVAAGVLLVMWVEAEERADKAERELNAAKAEVERFERGLSARLRVYVPTEGVR